MRVGVDSAKCAGIGLCEMTAPTVFAVGDDGLSRVINPDPSAAEWAAAREAVHGCPAKALFIEE